MPKSYLKCVCMHNNIVVAFSQKNPFSIFITNLHNFWNFFVHSHVRSRPTTKLNKEHFVKFQRRKYNENVNVWCTQNEQRTNKEQTCLFIKFNISSPLLLVLHICFEFNFSRNMNQMSRIFGMILGSIWKNHLDKVKHKMKKIDHLNE